MSSATAVRRPPRGASLLQALHALRSRNLRLYFVGQGISLIGTWMTRMATSWLVFRLTHSPLLLGVAGFAGQILSFFIGPISGVWVERLDRRRLLIWTQAVLAAVSLALAALTLSGHIRLWHIILLLAVQGVTNSLDMPARQAMLGELVEDRRDLGNAIALNSVVVNGTRLIGPALAGLTIAAVGEGWCFLLDGVSFFAVIASLLIIRTVQASVLSRAGNLLLQIRAGWHYVRTTRPIRSVLLLYALLGLLGSAQIVLLPIFASHILHGGPHTMGWLSAASGLGAFASGLLLVLSKTQVRLPNRLQMAIALFGVALLLFGFSHQLALSILAMFVSGLGLMQGIAICNTILQLITREDMRARVMSYFTMAFVGTTPFGSLLAGGLAERFGAPGAVQFSGISCLLIALWFTLETSTIRACLQAISANSYAAPTKPERDSAQAGRRP